VDQSGEQNNPHHRPVSPEQGALADDLHFFRDLAKSAPDPGIRYCAGRVTSCIEFFQRPESPFPKVLEQYALDEAIRRLTNEEIAQYLALNLHGGDSALRTLLYATFLPDALLEALQNEHSGQWDARDFDTVLTFLCLVFRRAIEREYLSRRQENEDKNGRAIRQIMVEQSKRGDLIQQLGGQITWGLFFPWEARWRSEDAPAEAYTGLWKEVTECTKTDPVAADPNCLRAFMEGSLNRIPGKVRDHIRTRIETESRHAEVEIAEQNAVGPGDPDSSQSQRVLAEMIPDKSAVESGYTKILVEQFLSVLPPNDKVIFEFCCRQGHSQKEAGTLLGLRQSQISKRLGRIRAAWKEVVQDPPVL
jgi:RNA polymerase sigma factor (sigma-70 family)